MIKILKVLVLIIFKFLINLNNNINIQKNQFFFFNNYFILINYKKIKNITISYNITNFEYNFSFKYKINKIKYDIIFYDEKRTLIKPSNLSLVYDLHVLCHIKQIVSGEMIFSIANIQDNKNFYCIEYIKIDESIEFGIKIYIFKNNNIEHKITFLLIDRYLNYNNLSHLNDELFNMFLISCY